MPVLASEGVVLGKIVTVKNTQSVVQTIFDGGWASSVVVGSEGAKGVLRGGSSPKLELVSRDSDIREGDTAFSASDDLPLGKLVGVVEKVERGQGNFWSDVSVRSLFNFEELRTVLVVTDFP